MIKKLLVTGGAAFVLFVLFDTFISPRITSLNEQREQLEAATSTIEDRVARVRGVDRVAVEAEVDQIQTQLPGEADQRAVIAELVEVFNSTGVEWLSSTASADADERLIEFAPTDLRRGDRLEVELFFQIEGPVDGIRAALDQIAGLDRRYTVVSVNLSFGEGARGTDVSTNATAAALVQAFTWVWLPSDPDPVPNPDGRTLPPGITPAVEPVAE